MYDIIFVLGTSVTKTRYDPTTVMRDSYSPSTPSGPLIAAPTQTSSIAPTKPSPTTLQNPLPPILPLLNPAPSPTPYTSAETRDTVMAQHTVIIMNLCYVDSPSILSLDEPVYIANPPPYFFPPYLHSRDGLSPAPSFP